MKWLTFKLLPNQKTLLYELKDRLAQNQIKTSEDIWNVNNEYVALDYMPIGKQQKELADKIIEQFFIDYLW